MVKVTHKGKGKITKHREQKCQLSKEPYFVWPHSLKFDEFRIHSKFLKSNFSFKFK